MENAAAIKSESGDKGRSLLALCRASGPCRMTRRRNVVKLTPEAPARSDNETSPKEKPEGDVKPFVVPAASAFKPLTVACALRCIWQMPMPCSVC